MSKLELEVLTFSAPFSNQHYLHKRALLNRPSRKHVQVKFPDDKHLVVPQNDLPICFTRKLWMTWVGLFANVYLQVGKPLFLQPNQQKTP